MLPRPVRLVTLMARLHAAPRLTLAEAVRLCEGDPGRPGDRRTVRADLTLCVEHDRSLTCDTSDRAHVWHPLRAHAPAADQLQQLRYRIGLEATHFLDGTLLRSTPPDVKDLAFDRIVVRQEPPRAYDDHDDVLNDLISALLYSNRVSIDYANRAGEERQYQSVGLLNLLVYRRAVYLLIDDPNLRGPRGALRPRCLAVDRIERAERHRGVRYAYPPKWDVEAYLRPIFGIVGSGSEGRVVLEFDAEVAPLVQARRWHPSQRLIPLPHGGVRLEMRCHGVELERFALEWGEHCEVIEPAALRDRVRAALAAANLRYGDRE